MNPEIPQSQPQALPNQIQGIPRRKLLIIGIALVLGVALLILLFGRSGGSSIEVRVTSDQTGDITYRFVNQKDQKVTEIKDANKTITARLPLGNYELTVSQKEASYFSIIKVEQEPKTVKAGLSEEKARRFIGNLAEDCRTLIDTVLVSYPCDSSFDGIQTHVPANTSVPTTTEPTFRANADLVEGLIRTNGGQSLLLLREVEDGTHADFVDQPHPAHSIYMVSKTDERGKAQIVDSASLTDLKEEASYRITPYKTGFIIYDKGFSHALYYDSPKATPVSLRLPDHGSPYTLSVKDDAYVVAFTEDERNGVVIYDGDSAKEYMFDQKFDSVRLCGEQKLCGLSGNSLRVFSLEGSEPKELYSVGDVEAIDNLGSGTSLLVARGDGVLELNVDGRLGFLQYTFGEYGYCGLQSTQDSFLLCIDGELSANSMLIFDQSQSSDSIDKKVAKLSALPDIETVSIYDTFINISPEVGEPEYREDIQGFGYDPADVADINKAITEAIKEVGIDTTKYHINNALAGLE